METTVYVLATGLTIILGLMVLIVVKDNAKRGRVLKRLQRGDACFVMRSGEPERVLIFRNLVDRKVMVCRYRGMSVEFLYEEIVININKKL